MSQQPTYARRGRLPPAAGASTQSRSSPLGRQHSNATNQLHDPRTAKYVLVVGSSGPPGAISLLYTWQWGGQAQLDNGVVAKRIVGSYHDIVAGKIKETAKADPAATLRLFPAPVAVPLISPEEETTKRNTAMLTSLRGLKLRGTIPGQQESESSKSSAPFFLLMGYTRCSQAGTWIALWLPDLSHTQILAYDGSIYSVMPQLYYQSFYHQTCPENNPVHWVEENCTYMYTMPIAVPLSAAPHAVPYDASNMLTDRPHVSQHVSEGTQSEAIRQSYSGTRVTGAAKPFIPLMPPPAQRPVGPPAPPGKEAIARLPPPQISQVSGTSRKPKPTVKATVLTLNQFGNVQKFSEPEVKETVMVHYKVNKVVAATGQSEYGRKKVTFYTRSQQGAPVAIPEALLQRGTKNVLCKERYWGEAPPISEKGDMQILESGVQQYKKGIVLIYVGKKEGLVFPTQAN